MQKKKVDVENLTTKVNVLKIKYSIFFKSDINNDYNSTCTHI